jgi:hypothetical protein
MASVIRRFDAPSWRTRRETVAREFKAVGRAGLIERRRGAIALSDAHHLRRLIEDAISDG